MMKQNQKFKLNREFSDLARLPPWERELHAYQHLSQQQQLATLSREVLNADGQAIVVSALAASTSVGQGNIGIGVSGTWVGTVSFFASAPSDPLNFFPVALTPFPSGTAVSATTANGNFFTSGKNYAFIKIVFARTSGSVQINAGVAQDSSYQDAFLTQASIFNCKEVVGGLSNTLTQAAQANRAWNLTSLEVCLNGPQSQGQPSVTVFDGTIAGTVLFKEYIPTTGGSIGYTYKCNLPTDANGNPTLVCTPGNAMTIQVNGIAPNGSSIINTKFSAA